MTEEKQVQEKHIRFADVAIRQPEVMTAVGKILATGNFIGSEQPEFEAEFSKNTGTEFAIGVASGSAALRVGIEALVEGNQIPMKDRHQYGWIVPALSFFATAAAVAHAGFTPIYVDVDEAGLMNQEQALAMLNKYEKECLGVIPVHMYGQWMRLEDDLVERRPVLEDAAQAFGVFDGLQGEAAAFSFYPAKNLGCAGDGGALVTDNWDFAEFARSYRNYGDIPGTKFNHALLGDNLRLDNIQAAILVAKLQMPMLHEMQDYRGQLAAHYRACGVESLATNKQNSWHLFPVLLPEGTDRVDFTNFMAFNGIQVGNHYPYILPQKVRGWSYDDQFPEAKKIANRVTTLPIGPHMSLLDVERVVEKYKSYLEDIDGH